jgi:hypothetical protein
MDNNIPLGITQVYNAETESTELSWAYLESADIEYFEIQYYNEEQRKWVPFDGRNGIIKKK